MLSAPPLFTAAVAGMVVGAAAGEVAAEAAGSALPLEGCFAASSKCVQTGLPISVDDALASTVPDATSRGQASSTSKMDVRIAYPLAKPQPRLP